VHKVFSMKNFFFKAIALVMTVLSFIFVTGEISPTLAATLTNASATLSNPRLSYRANTNTGGTAGASSVTINASGSYPDLSTNHLFPGDPICFLNAGITGCIGSVSYTVATISSGTVFSTSSPLTANTETAGFVTATQSGSVTLAFTLVNTIPAGGNIYIRVPVASTGNQNDGIADSGASTSTNGFDFNKLQSTNINVSTTGGTCTGGWSTPSVASTSGQITITKATNPCTGATVTIIIPGLVNPTPITTGHTQGQADAYKIAIFTRDGSNNVLDSTSTVVAPVEGVLVSANVDQTLSFQVAGVPSGQSGATYCNAATTVTSYPYAIPWGTIATANSFLNAAQTLTVSTNANNGYVVTIEESDQMGMNGNTCTGTTPAGDGYTFGAGKCIRDTVCDGACTEAVTAEWNTASNNGLGYSLASVSGTPAVFYYGESSRTYSARQIADYTQGGETKQNIMSSTIPVSGDSARVCYRISISGTQPAGYYYNTVKYTATARF